MKLLFWGEHLLNKYINPNKYISMHYWILYVCVLCIFGHTLDYGTILTINYYTTFASNSYYCLLIGIRLLCLYWVELRDVGYRIALICAL